MSNYFDLISAFRYNYLYLSRARPCGDSRRCEEGAQASCTTIVKARLGDAGEFLLTEVVEYFPFVINMKKEAPAPKDGTMPQETDQDFLFNAA